MKLLVPFGCIFLLFTLASSLYGEIYAWTDVHGIMHFTNYYPPPQAELFIRDVKPRRDEVKDDQNVKEEPEQPVLERHEIQEDIDRKLDETIRRMEDLERDLKDAEILNQGLKRKLIVANERADAALAYAEDLEYSFRDITTLPSSSTYYANTFYPYPIFYSYGYFYKVHKPRFKYERFYSKRHSTERYEKKYPKKSYHRSITGRSHFSKRHSVGIRQGRHSGGHITKSQGVGARHKRQLGSRNFRKSYRAGVRSSARFGHRYFRR